MDLLDVFNRLKLEVAKFGAIGLVAFIIHIGTFNLLLSGPLAEKPVTAQTIGAAVATVFAYFGNRFWTFRSRTRTSYIKEFIVFSILNAVGAGIQSVCIAISHYGFRFESVLADNISGFGFGFILGTLFRFWSYRKWVFLAEEPATATASE